LSADTTTCNDVPMDPSIQLLIDQQQIHDILMKYARGIDRCDFDLVRSCYHPGAVDNHGRFTGTIEEFIPWVETQLDQFDTTMHFLGNVLIEVEGVTAHAETYCVAYHRMKGEDVDNLQGLRYVDRFEKRYGEWRIAERAIVVEWNRIDDVDLPGFAPGTKRGRRDQDDLVYRR